MTVWTNAIHYLSLTNNTLHLEEKCLLWKTEERISKNITIWKFQLWILDKSTEHNTYQQLLQSSLPNMIFMSLLGMWDIVFKTVRNVSYWNQSILCISWLLVPIYCSLMYITLKSLTSLLKSIWNSFIKFTETQWSKKS